MSRNPQKFVDQFIVNQSVDETQKLLVSEITRLGGKIVSFAPDRIESTFGSLLKSRLLGEFFVSMSTLPKKAIIRLEHLSEESTKVTIDVRDTHKWGIKMGYRNKYDEALKELSASIKAGLQHLSPTDPLN